jgi:hypothetical protein
MKGRCYRETSQRFYTHGARGITVCDRWKNSYDNFIDDMGLKPNGMSIERIDNDGNYDPTNCRWASAKEQAYNRRTNVRHSDKTISEWAQKLGLSHSAMKKRLTVWTLEEAISVPRMENYARRKSN